MATLKIKVELSELIRDGIWVWPELIEAAWLEEIKAHLAYRPVYNAHVVAKSTLPPLPMNVAPWPAFSHMMEDAITAPYFFELALSTITLAQQYFDGEAPILYSMNALWTQPAPGYPPYLDTHGWHRDGDDRKQLVVFLFCSDTAPGDGAHRYQRGTHRLGDDQLGRDFRQPMEADQLVVAGPAGQVVIEDTGGLHVGERRTSGLRLLLWARWGVSDPPQSYHWDKLAPVPRALLGDRYPTDPALQSAIRHVVA